MQPPNPNVLFRETVIYVFKISLGLKGLEGMNKKKEKLTGKNINKTVAVTAADKGR